MIKKLFLLAALTANALFAQRYERLIETRTISTHEIVGSEYDASSNSVFILSNVSNQNGNGLLAKVNALNGDTIWSKFVAPTVQQENFKGLYKSSGALYAYGMRTLQSAQYAFIAKLDFNGDTIWTKHYNTLATTACTNPHIIINGIVELTNGDLVLVGRNNACDRAVLLRTNSLGVVSLIKEYDQWLQNIFSPLWDFYGIESDGTNYFVSARYGKAQQNWDYYKGIWKLDLNGDLVTNFNSQFAQNSEIFGFKRDVAGNLYLLGQHNPITQSIGILEKFNASGVSQWAYNPSGVTIQWSGITDIEFDAGGDVLVSGFFQKQNQSVDQFASRINSSTGAEVWIKQYGYGDHGYGRELVKVGTNYLMVSDENFGWNAIDAYGVFENNPPHSPHPVIQLFNPNGEVGRFNKSPGETSKKGKKKFFAIASFSFDNSNWSNVSLVPITLSSPTGGSSSFEVWNSNLSYAIYSSQMGYLNYNGVGTFYFTASDKNGDTRVSDTLEVLPSPSFTAFDAFSSPVVAACSGDSLHVLPDVLNVGSFYKWLFFGVSNNQAGTRVGSGLNFYVKQKGFYALREVLANGDSAQTSSVLLDVSTDFVKIGSSAYPQTFWVSGAMSDSTSRKIPSLTNWGLNRNLQHWIAPFGRYRQSNVQQYFYSVSDLLSLGVKPGSKISEIAFELQEAFSGGSLEEFKIAFRWGSNTTNSWVTMNGNDVVYDNYWQTPNGSAGDFIFDINDQVWNGLSSLTMQISYRVNGYNISTDQNPVFKLEERSATIGRVIFAQNTSLVLIGNTGAGSKSLRFRPLTKFKIGFPAKTDTIVACSSSIELSVQNSGYQALTWNNGSQTAMRTITSPGQVSVTMLDGNFCLSYDTVQVIINPHSNAIVASATTAAPGASITLAAQAAYVNLWSNGASGTSTSVSESGKYRLTSINSDGCSSVDSLEVVVLSSPIIYKGDRGAYRGSVLSGHTYMGKIGNSHVYRANTCDTWSNAVGAINQLNAKFWYPKSASENATLKALYNSKIPSNEDHWIGIFRPSLTAAWQDLSGHPVTFTNWDVNYSQSGLYAFIVFAWNGFWDASANTSDCRQYFISFEDESSIAGTAQTTCDSIKLWTPEGFSSYSWTNGTTALSTTSNEIWASTSGTYSVSGILNNTAYPAQDPLVLIVNQSPAISILNKSGTVDLTGANAINLKAVYPSGSVAQWFINGTAQPVGQDSVVSNTVGWHRVVVTLNGCNSMDSVRLSQPIFVAKTGNDQTGNGTLGLPYLTIQKGVDMATNGGKVYILPGNYVESVNITNPIILASNYFRLGHLGAVDSTKITSSNGAYSVRVTGNFSSDSSTSKIVGFTLTGKTTTGNDEGALTIKDLNGAPSGSYLVDHVKFVNNTMACCLDWSGAAIHSTGHNAHLIVRGGEISGNNSANQDNRGVVATNRRMTFDGVRIVNNFATQGIFKIWEAPRIDFVNCLISGNTFSWDALIVVPGWSGTEPTINFINSTIADNEAGGSKLFLRNGTAHVRFLNSIWKNTTVLPASIFESTTTSTISAVGSILPNNSVVPANKYGLSHIPAQNVYGNYLGLNSNYTLASSSSAIGLGVSSANLGGVILHSPNKDLNKGLRPNPSGSSPDAGAFESPLTQGVFTVSITNCGYLLTPVVSNAGVNYTTKWTGPNGFTSVNSVVTAPSLGLYTLKVVSIDRNDSVTVSYDLQNPLDFDLMTIKDVCASVSANSGAIQFGRVRGGQPYDMAVTQWWTYLTRFLNTSGQQVQGTWNVDGNDANWQLNQTGLTAGTYIVEAEDASGCKVQKQVVLSSKLGRKVFVSTTGLNSNVGTQSAPYATIQHAIDQACDRDTIIILNGTYNQDSIIVNKPLIIASNYLSTGDTNDIRNTVINGSNNRVFTYQGFSGTIGDTSRSMLLGVTIQNGVTAGRGGGVWVRNHNGEATLKISHSVIRDNRAQNGGGVATEEWGSYLVIANTRILNNYASDHSGGLFAHYNNTIVLRNLEISGNSAQNDNGGLMVGPAVVGRYIGLRIKNNTSVGGTPSGIFLGHNQTVLRNIEVTGNVGGQNSNHHFRLRFDGWGASVQGDELRVSNLLMANNVTQGWSGLYLDNGNNYSFINSTFVDNVSRNNDKGQIVLTDNTSIRLLNSIVTMSNGRTIIANGCSPGSVTIRNSAIEGGATGIQNESCAQNPFTPTLTSPNVTTAPFFVDRANGDYRLAKFSSLIGYGAVSATLATKTLVAPLVDLTGAARPQPINTKPDVGVYEHPDSLGRPGLNMIVVDNGSCQTANGAATVNLIRINNQPAGTPTISWMKLNDPTWTTQTTNTISGLSSGSYQVTVTVGTTAPFIDTAVVTTAAPLALVNNSLLTNCFGGNDGTLKFSIQGGSPFTGGTYKYDIAQLVRDGGVANYTDNSSQERSANFISTQRHSGTYRITVTDAKGCQFVDTITLGYRNALPTAQITASGPLTICEGDVVSLDATTTNATDMYSWNDGSTVEFNTVGVSGSRIVTVTDTAGCSNSDTVVVDVKANPVVFTGTPPAYSGDSLGIDYEYLGQHNGNHYYIYTNTNTYSWTQAKVLSEQFGGHLWVINDAAEQTAVNGMIQTNSVYYGEAYNGAYFEDGAWKWVTGEPFTYFNWAPNQANNGNGTIIRVQFNWGGQWERSGLGNQKFIIEFPNGARNLATSEALCDSVTVSAPEGFDAYVWKNTSNNNAVVGTSRSLKVTSSMAVKVEGTLNKSDGTTCTLESQTHTLTINQTPAASILNHSGTVDLYGSDTVILGANVSSGATWTWTSGSSNISISSNDTLLVTTPNKYVLKAASNGCERKDSVIVDRPLFVSVSGNNATGNGSFAAPYRTIQKGVNQAPSGGKVYVLPGNYVESVVVTKPVKIYSDFERLGSTTAIVQTKITSQNGNFSIAIRMDSSGAVQDFTKENMHISGFTIQGKSASNDMGAIDICPAPSFDWNNVNKQRGDVLISNIDFTNNTTQANNASAFASRGNEVLTYFENIKVRNSNLGVDPRGVLYFWQTKGGMFNNAQIFGNDGIVFNVDGQNMNMTFNNTAIFNNDIKGTTWGGYFNIQGSNNILDFTNSTVSGNNMLNQDSRIFVTNGSGTKVRLKNAILNSDNRPVYNGQVTFEARHSLMPLTSVLALADYTYYDTTNVHSSVARVQGYELLPNSPAIGIGSMLYASAKDIDGKNRPLPAGSNPDAGAFESGLAFGQLDLAITSCGYQVAATVLNSMNYSITWVGPGGFSSTQTSPLLPSKGIYQATLIAFDRQDTIVRTLNLNNPLEFSITSVKDVCEGVSANSGGIRVSQMKGGSIYQLGWGDYYLRVYRNGSEVWQSNIYNGPSNVQDIAGLSAGSHVIRLEDALGCFVYDTVVIGTQPSNTYFISTIGSDSALGTAANPLKTISEALLRACDGDTIVLEDGRHYENVIMGNNSPRLTIASRYLLDGDTNHIYNAIVDGMDVNPVFNISNLNNRNTTDTLRLIGFTVTNGLANSGWNGGGGIAARWSNVSLVNIRAIENRSGQNGGGIGIWECDLKLKNVLIKDNFATNDGGGLHLQYINNDLLNTNVRIVGNQSSNGGGLYYSHGLGNTGQVYELDGFEVINNFATNYGGGIYFGCWSGEADVQLSNSKVIGNRATNQSGGIVVQSNNADFFFVNNIIANNESGYAGAMSVNNSKAHFVHSTVYSNKHILGSISSVLNLAVHVENQSTVKMYNSILGGQGAGGKNVFIQDNQSFFEIVSGQLGGGVANTVQAPNATQITHSSSSPNFTNQQVFLKDPNGGDYSLSKVSQAIGRGLSSFVGAAFPSLDIFGNTRPNLIGSDPDFGAIESNDTAASFGVAFVVNDNNACNTSIGQITAFPQNGSGAYTYTWTALTTGGIISNPTGSGASHTIANLFSGLYRVVVTDVVTNAIFIDTAEIRGDNPIVITQTVNNESCQGSNDGSFLIDVTGGSGFNTYTWLRPNGTSASVKNLLNLIPGVYSVTVTDNKGCSVSVTDTVGTSFLRPTLTITSQIVKAGGIIVNSTNDARMCIGDQVIFNAGAGYDYYEWNKADGLNTTFTQTASSFASETFSVYVEDTNGCSTAGTAKIFVVYEPNVYASNVNRTMGQQFQQVTSYVRGDTTAQSNVTSNEVSPYNAQGNSLKKSQFVISASELQGAGLTENTTINSLAFDVVNPSGTAFQAYKIKLAHTTAQQLGSWQSPASQQEVFAIPVYAPVQGWNTHNFNNSFAWNGVDNLLVEVCYTPIGNAMSSASVRVNRVATANTLTNFSYSTNSCSDPVQSMGSSTWRPTVRFGIDKVEVLDTIRVCDFTTLNTTDDYDTYTWFVNGVASPTAALALNLTIPANVYLVATDAASNCVMRSDTFNVALDLTPAVVATSNAVGVKCAGDTITLSTTSTGLAQYLWTNGDTTMTTKVYETGAYILEGRSSNGCVGSDTVVVTVNTPPTVVVKLNGKTLTATDGSLASKVNTCVQSVLLPLGENFEDSLYVWTQSTTDQLDWTFNSGATNTQFSGPNGDFTTTDSSGNYYYLDPAGSNSDDNKEAHLISPCVQMIGASKPYLTFGYHMFNGLFNGANPSSDNMGTLRIEIQTTDDAANYWVPLWSKSGHQGQGWKSDTVDLTPFAGQTIRLRIVGKAGVGGPRSEMAIDGISIIDTANSYANTAGRISADIICEGDLLVAQAISNGSSQFNYMWNTGDTTSALKVDSTGYYYVSVMDENGCSVHTDSVFIQVSPIPNNALIVTGDLNNCYYESVAVTVQAPLNYTKYSWFSNDTSIVPGGTTSTLATIQGLAIGNYALGVRIFDSIGCASISDTVVVNRYLRPLIQDSITPVACFGDSTGSIVVTALTGTMSWNWSNGDSTNANLGLPTGLYTLVFTDEHGCSDTTSMNVIEPAPLGLTFSSPSTQPVSCFNGSDGSIAPIVTGGNGGYLYSWTGTQFSSTSDTLSILIAGTYVLGVTDAKGCFISDTHLVVQPAILSATVDSAWNASCFQANDGWISVNVAGGNGGYSMNWINSQGQSVGANDTVTNLIAGTYQFIVTDLKGCTDSLVHVVTEPQLLDISTVSSVFVGGNSIRCFGDSSGAITTSTVGGTLPYQWQWSNGSVAGNIDSLIAGTYVVTVTDLRGCQDSASVVLSEPSSLLASSAVQDVLCNDDQSGGITISTNGAIAPYWLDWTTSGVDSGLTRVTLVLDLRSAGSITSPSVGIVGIANNIPMLTYHNDSIYYLTVERQLGSTMYYRFFNGATPELVPLACGVNPPSLTTLHRSLAVGANDTTLNRVCYASCLDCNGQVVGSRSSILVGSGTSIVSQGAGVITMTIVDANGCLVLLNDTIEEPDLINIQLDTIVDVSCPQAGDGSIQLTTIGGIMPYAFDWSNGDTIEDLLTVNEGTYTITITDFNGCIDTASYEIMAPMPYNFEEVCMLTVDSLTGKNQVVWNKTSGKQTMEYQIFKETNVAGQYAQIGTAPYLSMSVFTDVNSVPQQQPDRYKIAVVDSCGNVSDTSDLHRTIHLQSSFGSSGEVNLSWTPYEGRAVQTYEIYRWISAGNLVQIGSVSGASNTFSDLNPPVAPIVNYNVRAIFSGDVCAPAVGKTSSYESARSNILDQTGIGMPDLPWKGLARMFPNPTNAVVRIEVPEAGFMIRVTNLLGQVIHQVMVQEQAVNIDLAHVAAGMYQVELYREGQMMSIEKLHVVH